MTAVFQDNPVFTLFVVIALGYVLGQIKLRGSSLGVAAVLFVGLAMGSISPDLQIPQFIILLGLTMFVYAVGLDAGPAFMKTFQRRGSKDILFIIGMLTFSAGIAGFTFFLLPFTDATVAGMFAGSSTNTAALAGLLDQISVTVHDAEMEENLGRDAVVAYSLCYPMGLIASILAINWLQRWLKVDYQAEAQMLKDEYMLSQDIRSCTIHIGQNAVVGKRIRELKREHVIKAVFSRIQRNDEVQLIGWETMLEIGDIITVVGEPEELQRIIEIFGEKASEDRTHDRSVYDIKEIFVSNPAVGGEKLATLNIHEHFSAIMIRLRRGDLDLLIHSNTIIELGDQIRLLAKNEDIPRLEKLFGNSLEAINKINLFSFGFGIALGLLIGMIEFTFPGGVTFKLGFAGGPLIVALILGSLRKTGSIIWTLPFGISKVLRQLGLTLLLAGIGINSGHTFFQTLQEAQGLTIIGVGAFLSMSTAILTLFVGYKWLKIPFTFLSGMVANQPAVLDHALTKASNNLPNIGFTLMFPIALILKIIYVQLLFAVL